LTEGEWVTLLLIKTGACENTDLLLALHMSSCDLWTYPSN
jgi:hypothetical protein